MAFVSGLALSLVAEAGCQPQIARETTKLMWKDFSAVAASAALAGIVIVAKLDAWVLPVETLR